jgi:hypothetical protein
MLPEGDTSYNLVKEKCSTKTNPLRPARYCFRERQGLPRLHQKQRGALKRLVDGMDISPFTLSRD